MTDTQTAGSKAQDVVAKAESYYDSADADNFYFNIWGGEDIHIGLYDSTDDIAEASRLTVEKMAAVAAPITDATKILDVGAGYGGAARFLAKRFGCQVDCLNISQTQNATNRRLTEDQGLADRITVVHGSFEDIPEEDGKFDLVWSQDAILHSGRRQRVLEEVTRVLKPGGRFVFTDPMQADDCPEGVLQAVYDRIHLENLGSFAAYREMAGHVGLEVVETLDRSAQLRNHYHRVGERLAADYDRMASVSSKDYLDRMLKGLTHWVEAADKGFLAWGILHMRKP
ncbi:methyltransferase domain-containing protein [Magnetospira sp. QH-2]|uniref:methyltransferase domain-containing protein n=1 Tax=Magnetospira sp. (strain QH-2) TaxID=1288970 RepID=UPI0003E810FC|nr:methyltransferase domain-containing protein [Magnetospira sp. QH-2]CCQ75066.1 putative sarcosine/dimethylglycine N-methyltransferase [Magnetospira sp. QH-2]